MNPTIILGAGGFARELLLWIVQSFEKSHRMHPTGFFRNDEIGSKPVYGLPVINSLKGWDGWPFIPGVGDPALKKKLVDIALSNGLYPADAAWHDNNTIGHGVIIHAGTFVCPRNIITCDVNIGHYVTVNIGCTIGHDAVIGDYTTLSPGVNVSGRVKIGASCYLGTNAALREGIEIVAGTTIGMGAVVVKSITEPGTYVGNPAKKIKGV